MENLTRGGKTSSQNAIARVRRNPEIFFRKRQLRSRRKNRTAALKRSSAASLGDEERLPTAEREVELGRGGERLLKNLRTRKTHDVFFERNRGVEGEKGALTSEPKGSSPSHYKLRPRKECPRREA